MLKRFVREEEGATMVEYGLMIALIAVVLIVIVCCVSFTDSFGRRLFSGGRPKLVDQLTRALRFGRRS